MPSISSPTLLLVVVAACGATKHPAITPSCEQAIGTWGLTVRWQPAPSACPALPWEQPLRVVVERIVDSGNPHVFSLHQPRWGATDVQARDLSDRGSCQFDLLLAGDTKPGTEIEAHLVLRSGGTGTVMLDGPAPACHVTGDVSVRALATP